MVSSENVETCPDGCWNRNDGHAHSYYGVEWRLGPGAVDDFEIQRKVEEIPYRAMIEYS